jgi:hypothetical protein
MNTALLILLVFAAVFVIGCGFLESFGARLVGGDLGEREHVEGLRIMRAGGLVLTLAISVGVALWIWPHGAPPA